MNDTGILRRIEADIAAAMKSRDRDTLSTLRMLKSALMEAKTKKPRDTGLSPEEEIEILRRYAKKRQEVIEELRRAGREDLVAREEREIQVTGRYLPQALDEDALRELIRATVAQTGAAGPRDAGRVIGAVMAQARGRVEGGTVSRLVREILGG